MMLGLGHDVVDVGAFAEQLEMPGTRMTRLFSARECRQASLRASIKHDGEALHLAAKWAAKESVVKAWCEALVGRGITERPYTVASVFQTDYAGSIPVIRSTRNGWM